MAYHILQIIDSLEIGGAERVAVNLSNELSKAGHQVVLCATRKSGQLEKDILPGINFYCLHKKTFVDFRAIKSLSQICKNNAIEIIHAHSSSIFLTAIFKLSHPKIKLLCHLHKGNMQKDFLFTFFCILFRKLIDGFITVAFSQDQWLQKSIGIESSKIWKLNNFFSSNIPEQAPDLPLNPLCRIIYVANLHPPKDHHTLVKAVSILQSHSRQWELFLVGRKNGDNYSTSLEAMISNLNLEDKVHFLGEQTNVQEILASCDIGIISSTSEGMPMALLEYGMAGLPVVATRVGDIPEILEEGKNGILVPPGSPEKLAAGISQLLNEPGLRQEFGEKLKKKIVASYQTGRIIHQLENIYESVID